MQSFRLTSDSIVCDPHTSPCRYRTTPVVSIHETCTRELKGSHCDMAPALASRAHVLFNYPVHDNACIYC